MSELGRLLKQGREAQGLTLGDIEHSTHIRRAYLAALEEGRRDQLPDLVYTRGLVLNYARYLGIDLSEAGRLFRDEYGRALVSDVQVDSHQPLAEPLRLASTTWIKALVGLVAVVGIAFALWWYWPELAPWWRWAATQVRKPVKAAVDRVTTPLATATATATLPAVGPTARAEAAATEAAGEPSVSSPPPTSAALPLPTPTTHLTETPTEAPTDTPAPLAGLNLAILANSPAWTRVTADGAVVYEGTLATGDVREFVAQQSLLLHTGNAGGLEVVLNGVNVGSLGEGGEVVRRLWLWTGEGIAEATPEA